MWICVIQTEIDRYMQKNNFLLLQKFENVPFFDDPRKNVFANFLMGNKKQRKFYTDSKFI
jgi:hypothetical protein